MKATILAALAAAATASAQTVQFDVKATRDRIGKPPALHRRSLTQTAANNITGGGYYVEVEVGRPGQKMHMVLDTGSSDAWIVSREADLCSSPRLQQYYGDSCGGTYDARRSSGYELVERDGFSITYLDQSEASGDYIADDFRIAGTTVRSLQMGLAVSTGRGSGVLGIGFAANEATRKTYPNLVDQLARQGKIRTRAYSLWLNDRRSPAGSILFGGIDTAKFVGPLAVVPILRPARGDYTSFAVALTDIQVGKNKNASSLDPALPAILDSGTTLSYLPPGVAEDIFSALDAYTDSTGTGLTLVDCGLLDSAKDMTLTFSFGLSDEGAEIVVPVYEMVLDILGDYRDQVPDDVPFSDVCVLGIQAADDSGSSSASYALLGDTVLRSAYVVYDLDHKQIGLAQANLDSPESHVHELSSGDRGIPTTLTGASAQQTTFTPSSTATGTSSINSGRPTTTSDRSEPSETDNAAGGGPGFGPGGLVVTVLAAVLVGFGGVLFSL